MTPEHPAIRAAVTGRGAFRLLTVAMLIAFVVWQLVLMAPGYREAYKDFSSDKPVLGGSDFPAFYMGARLILSSQRAASYDEATQARTIVRIKGFSHDLSEDSGWYRYYNPPVYSLLLSPLGLLPVRTAYVASLAANAIALAGLAWLLGSILRWRRPMTPLVLAATGASTPVLYAFWHAQPDILLCLIIGGAFLLAERAKPGAAGAVLALATIKPQWLLLPGVALLRLRPRSIRAFVLMAALMALPFLLLGVGGTLEYIRLVRSRGYGDVHDDGFAEALLSWSGFLRAYTGHVQPDAWLALSFVTTLAFVPVWRSGNRDLLPPASVLTTLLIGPHSHPQDWLLIAPAACFMLRHQSGWRLAVSTALLFGIVVGVNAWSGAPGPGPVVYWPTVAGAASLLWIAGLALGADHAVERLAMRLVRARLRPRYPAVPHGGMAAPEAVRDRLY